MHNPLSEKKHTKEHSPTVQTVDHITVTADYNKTKLQHSATNTTAYSTPVLRHIHIHSNTDTTHAVHFWSMFASNKGRIGAPTAYHHYPLTHVLIGIFFYVLWNYIDKNIHYAIYPNIRYRLASARFTTHSETN